MLKNCIEYDNVDVQIYCQLNHDLRQMYVKVVILLFLKMRRRRRKPRKGKANRLMHLNETCQKIKGRTLKASNYHVPTLPVKPIGEKPINQKYLLCL